jgi:hypothetical protein
MRLYIKYSAIAEAVQGAGLTEIMRSRMGLWFPRWGILFAD